MRKAFLLLCLCGTAASMYADAYDTDTTQANGACSHGCSCAGNSLPPVGVMAGHIHEKGHWMFSYLYMDMNARGNRQGTTTLTDAEMNKTYLMAPQTMGMQVHMLMGMYGVTDRLSVMVMTGYANNSMSMEMGAMSMPGMVMPMGGMTMQGASDGMTDTRVSVQYALRGALVAGLGVDLPTGSIRQTGTTLLGNDQRLPYGMQPGTGTVNLCPDMTYTHEGDRMYWGANAGANIKTDYNALGYRNGNELHASAWAGCGLLGFAGGTLRAEGVHTGRISGYDPAINTGTNPENDPTANTANYGGNCVNVYAGLNFYRMTPVLQHFRLMTEVGMPVYQNLNGTQMNRCYSRRAVLHYTL
jgi:hypothetical protein